MKRGPKNRSNTRKILNNNNVHTHTHADGYGYSNMHPRFYYGRRGGGWLGGGGV